jgi:hypothetical protein
MRLRVVGDVTALLCPLTSDWLRVWPVDRTTGRSSHSAALKLPSQGVDWVSITMLLVTKLGSGAAN